MDCKWERVLIQWVNGLALTNFIENLESLRNGEFFACLLDVLAPQQTCTVPGDCLNSIIHLMKVHYPNFVFDERNYINLQTISLQDLVTLCSLLMHYTYVVERKETLMTPLCDSLPRSVQVCIRTFLEKVTCDVSLKALNSIIDECVKIDDVTSAYQWMSEGDSPQAGLSPLQVFLKTPVYRLGRIVERDREIKKLRAVLELEQFEKADFQEEIKELKEKNKGLGNQLKEKCNDISKLRSELYAIENRTPPHHFKVELRDIERHLQSEIQNLEQYITQLRSEQDELQDENDKIIEKLKKCEEERKIWQQKSLAVEAIYDELTDKYTHQGQELGHLRLQCNEMSALLEELRSSKNGNDSYLDTTGDIRRPSIQESAVYDENLAETVVEIQLNEVQKEKANLQELLKESLQRGDLLQEELSTLTSSYDGLSKDFEVLQTSNLDLVAKLYDVENSETALKNLNAELNERVSQLLKISQEKEESVLELQVKLKNVSASYKDTISFNEMLRNDLKNKHNEYEAVEKKLVFINDEYINIKREGDALQENYKNAIEKYNKSAFEVNSLQMKYNTLDKSMGASLNKLEKMVYGYNEINFEDKCIAFNHILLQLENDKVHDDNEKKNLQNALSDSNYQISLLKQEIVTLNEQEKMSLKGKQLLQNSLKTAEQNIDNLQKIIADKCDQINQLNSIIDELNDSVKQLDTLKDIVAVRDTTINQMQKELILKNECVNEKIVNEERMNGIIQTLNITISGLHCDLTNKDKEIKTYINTHDIINKQLQGAKKEICDMKEIEEQLKKGNLKKEKQFLEKTHLLNLQIQKYMERIAHLESELNTSKHDYNMKANELVELEQVRQQTIANYEAITADLSKKNELVTETSKKLEIELQVITKEQANLQQNLKDLMCSSKKMMQDKDDMLKEIEHLKTQVKSHMHHIRNVEDECTQKDTVISENSIELLNTKLELEAKKQAYKCLQENVEKLNLDTSSYVFCIDTLKAKNDEFQAKISELTGEIVVLNHIKVGLEKKNKELELNLENIVSNLSVKNEKLNVAIENLALHRKKSEQDIQNVNILLDEANKNLEDLSNDRTSIVEKYDRDILLLTDEVASLKSEISTLNMKEIDCLQDLQATKYELSDIFSKYTENLTLLQEMKSENESQVNTLTENIHSVVEKYNKLECSYKEAVTELSELTAQLREIEKEKISLEVKIVDEKKKYEQELEQTNEQFGNDIKNLSSKHEEVTLALEKANADLEIQRGIKHRLENDVKKLQTKLHIVDQEKLDLISKMELLEQNKLQLETNYKELKLVHENYVLDSESNLQKLEAELQTQNKALAEEKDELKRQILVLENAVSSLEFENKTSQELYEKTTKSSDKYLKDLQQKIDNHEANITKIDEDQKLLQQHIILQRNNYNETKAKLEDTVQTNKAKSVEYENEISKLKCAFDILQTGKDKLELEHHNLKETCKRIKQEELYNKEQLKEKLKLNSDEIENLSKDIEIKHRLTSEKDEEIKKVTMELRKIKIVLEAMSSEKQAGDDNLAKLKDYLTKIEEENLFKITEMSDRFKELAKAHEDLNSEQNMLRSEYDRINKEYQQIIAEKSQLEKDLNEKETALRECREKSMSQEEVIKRQENLISKLNDNLRTYVSELEHLNDEKVNVETELEKTETVLRSLKKNREDMLESQAKIIKEKENNVLRAHADAVEVKNDLLKQIQQSNLETAQAMKVKNEIEQVLRTEKEAKEFLETRVLTLTNEKLKYSRLYFVLRKSVDRINELIDEKPIENCLALEDTEENDLNTVASQIEQRIVDVFKKRRELTELIAVLEANKTQTVERLELLEKEKQVLNNEKEKLLKDYKIADDEKANLIEERAKDGNLLKTLQGEFLHMKSKYEENVQATRGVEVHNGELQQKLLELKDRNIKAFSEYQEFTAKIKVYRNQIDGIVKDRNTLEGLVHELKQGVINVQMKHFQLGPDSLSKQQSDQKEALDVVTEDIQKQFSRNSKILYNLHLHIAQITENVVEGILSEQQFDWKIILKDLTVDEISYKLDELKDRATDALEQVKVLEKSMQTLEVKPVRVLKENVSRLNSTSSQNVDVKRQEDEWKRKYTTLKQKLTLTENVKNNYEKKLKQLREDNKKLSAGSKDSDKDHRYQALLQQHVQIKEEYEKVLCETRSKHEKLTRDYEDLRMRSCVVKSDEKVQTERDVKADKELSLLREAYGRLMSDNSRLELDAVTLRKLLDERNSQLGELSLIKEAYEKLLEENSKFMTEVDTLKYKRSRDKEEFIRVLKKEREEADGRENKKIQGVRVEYESKLEKMKDKMIKLYKEEVQKEMEKMLIDKTDNEVLIHSAQRYKTELEEARDIINQLRLAQKRNVDKQHSDFYYSNESSTSDSLTSDSDIRSVSSILTKSGFDERSLMKRSNTLRNGRESVSSRKNVLEERKYSTIPRNLGMDVIKEVRICATRTAVNPLPTDMSRNLEMEDEGDLFNNKYLTDLQEGKCVVPSGRDSRSSRMSELAWRNSLCPPHLKSSYPAETQFSSPSHFKEDDLKTGNIDFDDSMSSRLLPGEKPRKKDIGTTSYKKPGPPTPSKNGGRLSLQGGEHTRDVLRDHNESKTPKRTTPSRLKALFMGRNTSVRDNSENQPITPKTKRLSNIFRKPR